MYSAEIMKMSPKYRQHSQRQVVGSWHWMMQVYFSRPRNSNGKVWHRNRFQPVPGRTPPPPKRKKMLTTITMFCLNRKSFQGTTTIPKIQIHCGQGEDKNFYRTLKSICSVCRFVVAKEEGTGLGWGEGLGVCQLGDEKQYIWASWVATSCSRAGRTVFTIVWYTAMGKEYKKHTTYI